MLKVTNLLDNATKERELKVNASTHEWLADDGVSKIEKYFIDPDGIFSTERGYKAGVYEVDVVTPNEKEIGMYIGEVGKDERGFVDRLTEHARYWLENPQLYTGVKVSELKEGYKFKVRILAEESDYEKRYALEQAYIESLRPYLQFNCYAKYDSKYRGYDLAIFVTYRRRAFVVARDGKYTEETEKLFVENIYELDKCIDFNEYRMVNPNVKVVELVEKEMPNGSELWRRIKTVVEDNMGITSKRGCNYLYLVRIVAAILESAYEVQVAL